jgi:hypothetical protein
VDCVNINIAIAFAAFKSDEYISCGFCSGYDRPACMRISPKNLNWWFTHCSTFYNVHRFLRKTASDICGSMHHHLINKTTNVRQLGAIVFIIPWKVLYMFRVLLTPIIRSVLKLYMQLLVQSRIGVVSDSVCYKMFISGERTALCHDQVGHD